MTFLKEEGETQLGRIDTSKLAQLLEQGIIGAYIAVAKDKPVGMVIIGYEYLWHGRVS